MRANRCIWCLGPSISKHIEHIVPEALGSPPDFILSSGEVCRPCNNGLAHLDQAVAEDFDFLSLLAGIPRKRGRPPRISSRGNVYGSLGEEGPEIIFNMDGTPMTAPDGGHIAGYRRKARDIEARWDEEGSRVYISFDCTFASTKKFQRGIYKIALSALAYFTGPSELYKSTYDPLRQYVRKGTGNRHIMVIADEESGAYRHHFIPPMASAAGDYALEFRLAGVRFIVDLSRLEDCLPRLTRVAERTMGKGNWAVMPAQ